MTTPRTCARSLGGLLAVGMTAALTVSQPAAHGAVGTDVRSIVAATGTTAASPHVAGVSRRAAVLSPDCADVLVVAARGSAQKMTDWNGMGPQVGWFVRRLRNQLAGHRTVAVRVLDSDEYPAHSVSRLLYQKLNGTNDFFEGIANGKNNTVTYLEKRSVAGQCPNERIVLAGYSQGAMVMHRVIDQLVADGDRDVVSRIDGAVLLADGDRVRNTATNLVGVTPAGIKGIGIESAMGRYNQDVARKVASVTWTVCQKSDLVCDFRANWLEAAAIALVPLAVGPVSELAYAAKNIHTGKSYIDSSAIRTVARNVATQLGTSITGAGTTTRLTAGDENSWWTTLSADGRYVAFNSFATNLVSGDTNGFCDVFVRDTATGVTRRITDGAGGSGYPTVSGDGRYVAFTSGAANLVSGDTNGRPDVFIYDTVAGLTRLITNGNYTSEGASISSDGRYIAFESDASDLVPGDTNGTSDVFVYDTTTNTTRRITDNNDYSGYPAISSNGRYIAFESDASNLAGRDTNGTSDVFVYDTATSTTRRITSGNDESAQATISGDGRYIAFHSWATNLVASDTNAHPDIFVYDTTTGATGRLTGGNGDSLFPTISADGRSVAYESDASNLVGGDTNGETDVFLWRRFS